MKESLIQFPEEYRWIKAPLHYASSPGDRGGAFRIPARKANGRNLLVIADAGDLAGWEHVSVSLHQQKNRAPSWEEMKIVKDLFWPEEACCVQFHPPKSDYVNITEALHIWRPLQHFLPIPDQRMV